MNTLTAVDLFAGCGGTSCGLMQAGLDVVAMVEYDCTAAITYMANLCRYDEHQLHFITPEDAERMEDTLARALKRDPKLRAGSGWIAHQPRHKVRGCHHVIIGDIRQLSGAVLLHWLGMERGELGHMSLSPPCQGFSTANPTFRQKLDTDPRNDLCFEAARLIVECQPHTICLENVPFFAKSKQCEMFKKLLQGGPGAVRTFEHLLPKHPHWAPLLAMGDIVRRVAKEHPEVRII